MRRALVVLAVLCAPLAMHVAEADASVKAVNGRCGMHAIRAVFPYLHRWHVRIGPKHHNPTGRKRCFGSYLRSTGPISHGLSWGPFDVRGWNWKGIVDVSTQGGVTAAACGAFAAALAGEVPSIGSSSLFLFGTGAGCARAAYGLSQSAHDDFAFLRR